MKIFQETPMDKDDESEESSWTSYFEEFIWQNDQKAITSCHETPKSLVLSDTTSSAIVKKPACFQDDQPNKLKFNKRKHEGAIIDDSLEDTATSSRLITQKEEVGKCEEHNKRSRVGSNLELRKRGLCLVPLSLLADIFLESQDIFSTAAQPFETKAKMDQVFWINDPRN